MRSSLRADGRGPDQVHVFTGDDGRWTITEAAWHVKYALFPQEGRI